MTKTRAIVLRAIKYGEAQLIVDVFTEVHGYLAFLVKIPQTSKARVKRQYFQPLSLLSIDFEYKEKARLQHFRNAEVDTPLVSMRFSPYKLSISLFLAEFLGNSVRNEQGNDKLFLFIWDSILWLEKACVGFANFHIVFMMRLTFFLGVFPNLSGNLNGRYFDLQEGCFVDSVPLHSFYLCEEDSAKLLQLFRLRYQTMHLYVMSRMERNRCVEVIIAYYKLHVPNFPELKTLPILRELFVSSPILQS